MKSVDARQAIQDIVGCKWTVQVVRAVEGGQRRPAQIQRAVEGITVKVMNERLRKLLRHGVLTRVVFPEVPPHVEYRLTDRGRQLRPLLREIDRLCGRWGGDSDG